MTSECHAIEVGVSSTRTAVAAALNDLLEAVLLEAGQGDEAIPSGLPERRDCLQRLLDERRETAFPLTTLNAGPDPTSTFELPDLASLRRFSEAARKTDQKTARLSKLFAAALEVPEVADADAPCTCPLCGTSLGLTPARIAEIRKHVAEHANVASASKQAREELQTLGHTVDSAARSVVAVLPTASNWNDQQRNENRDLVSALVGETGVNIYDDILELLGRIQVVVDGASEALERIQVLLAGAGQAVDATTELDVDAFLEACQKCTSAVGRIGELREEYVLALLRLVEPLRTAIDRSANVGGWAELIQLVQDLGNLVEELRTARAEDRARNAVQQAVRDIDTAKAAVFDARFEAISEEIRRWWNLMRREQQVSFGGVRRRGTGRRFIDFKATIRTASDDELVERDAVGVYSDSQLNCLGLSAFLARCSREGGAIVVLDDPVLASDEEHRTTFARYVLEALTQQGTQALVATHDNKLARLVQDYYGHLPVDVFHVTCEDLGVGAQVEKISDALGAMLASARPYIRNLTPEIRKIASTRLRDAAERLCKEIVVKGRRAKGQDVSIIDFDGKTLEQLRPLVEPYLTGDPSHPGKLQAAANVLNPGSHEDVVPDGEALAVVLGDMKRFKSDYL